MAEIVAAPNRGRLAEIVSDSLAASTEGTDWAEAPIPSDEPGSPYVLRLTNEIASRLPALDVDRLARARHRWQHPTFAFGDGRCACPGWAKTVGEMLELLAEDERRAAER